MYLYTLNNGSLVFYVYLKMNCNKAINSFFIMLLSFSKPAKVGTVDVFVYFVID